MEKHAVPVRLTSVPLGLRWVLQNGFVFPALHGPDGHGHADSFNICSLLEQMGHPLGVHEMSPQSRNAAQVDLEDMFANYALSRCLNGRRWAFIQAWAQMREAPPSRCGPASRAFLSVYFWVLIRLGIHLGRRKGRPVYDLALLESQLGQWDERLAAAAFLTGRTRGFLDFALWGHLQCMYSGLSDELLPVIRRQPHVLAWPMRMTVAQPVSLSRSTDRLGDGEAPMLGAPPSDRGTF